MEGMLGNWKFWFAVIIVVVVAHLAISFVAPKLMNGAS